MNPEQPATPKPAPSIRIDLRLICVVLLLIIAGMLAVWKPWQHTDSTRKITIDGTATVKAVPDEFVFNPSFEQSGGDIQAAKDSLNAKGTKINNDLQKLGVKASDIQLDSSSYNYYPVDTFAPNSQTLTLNATITVDNKDLAQKVQDYLAGTDAKGQLTATPQFSTAKQKQLNSQARLAAIADAKQQAGQTAANLNGKLGKVLSVADKQDNGVIRPLIANGAASAAPSVTTSLPVMPGQSDVTANVEVVFALN